MMNNDIVIILVINEYIHTSNFVSMQKFFITLLVPLLV